VEFLLLSASFAPVEPSFGEDDVLEESPDVDDAGEGSPCTSQVDGT